MTIEELSDICERWNRVVGGNLKYYKADPQDLSDMGRLIAIDFPVLLNAVKNLVALNASITSGGH